MPTTVKIMAILVAKPGKTGDLRALLESMIAPSRAETGNLRYDLWLDQTNPERFFLDELYTDNEAVLSHRATPHFTSYLSKIKDIADRTAFVLDPVHIT